MDYVYRSGFIDTATGNALDLVVSILGVERKGAERALGTVIFGRTAPPPLVEVRSEVILYDGREQCELRQTPVEDIVAVTGTSGAAEYSFTRGVDYELAGDEVRWLPSGRKPDSLTEVKVDYRAYQRLQIPEGTQVSTFAPRPEDARVFGTTKEVLLGRTSARAWEVNVPVRAIVPGPEGNVLSGSITLMPQPVEGVEYVINRTTLTGGGTPETDEELRQRAKREVWGLGGRA